MDYVIRNLTSADEPVLWEMLDQALQSVEPTAAVSSDLARQPQFARYVEGWGRTGDSGFVAHEAKGDRPLGAVWLRVFPGEPSAMPNLAFAVKRGHRRHGIGAALLTQLVKANPQHSAIRIRAAANNPAVRLYERFGFKIVREGEDAVTMRREV
jgi:ribosomal protein S18 acetylase RimI-like enzyme